MPEMADVRCEDCGAIFPMIVGKAERGEGHVWYPGRKCPICGSEKFFPLVRTDKFEPKPLAKWKVDRRVGIAAGIVIFVFLIVGLVWYLHERPHRRSGLTAVYMCDVCGELFVKSVRGKTPKKCPACKNWEGYRAVQCLNCYEVYPLKGKVNPNDPPMCPKCKSRSARIIVRLGDIQKKPPKKQEKEGQEIEANEEESGIHPD